MMPVTLLDLELEDWLDASLPSNLWMVGRSLSAPFEPLEPRGPWEAEHLALRSPFGNEYINQ